MSKVSDPEKWEELLYDYEESEGFSKTVSAEYLIDQSLDLLEELKEFSLDGRFYETYTLLVETGAPLPELHKEITVTSFIAQEKRIYKVMGIQSVKWGDNGIAITFYGKKIKTPVQERDES